eukprot:3432100-Pleurochrysis_carterae.AAC.1
MTTRLKCSGLASSIQATTSRTALWAAGSLVVRMQTGEAERTHGMRQPAHMLDTRASATQSRARPSCFTTWKCPTKAG